jgi:transcriptional regulator with XRE-family HTH domain
LANSTGLELPAAWLTPCSGGESEEAVFQSCVSVPVEDTFGSRLKEIRKRRGLSQVELARRLGLHQSLISQYECGYLRLHGTLLVRLARGLDTTPDEILAGTPTTPAADAPPLDRRFLRRLKQVEKLSAHQQKILLGTIDAFIAKVS